MEHNKGRAFATWCFSIILISLRVGLVQIFLAHAQHFAPLKSFTTQDPHIPYCSIKDLAVLHTQQRYKWEHNCATPFPFVL